MCANVLKMNHQFLCPSIHTFFCSILQACKNTLAHLLTSNDAHIVHLHKSIKSAWQNKTTDHHLKCLKAGRSEVSD